MLIFGLCMVHSEAQDVMRKSESVESINKEKVATLDSLGNSKAHSEQIQDIIDYTSEEQYFDVKNMKAYLVKNANVKYLDMEIQAEYVEIDFNTNEVYAVGNQDSTGRVISSSIFKQGGRELEYGSFSYNLKTKKGKAFNVRTEESLGSDRGLVVAGVVKQYNDSVSGMREIAYTTDEYFINKKDSIADYHLEAKVGKMIKGKEDKIITGPIVMKIYNIATPFILPFTFLPTGSSRSAGLLLPSFGERNERGFYLEGFGYYHPFGDYVDLAVTGDLDTKGSLGLHLFSNYKLRYKFNGNLSFDWLKTVSGIKGLSNYNKSFGYNINWSHRQDPKSNPNLDFNAQVRLRSNQYYEKSFNNYGLASGAIYDNNVYSSISLTKKFPNTPFTSSLNIFMDQSVNSRNNKPANISLQLPTFVLNMSRITPFAPKNGPKKGLLQSLGITYSLNAENKINTISENLFTRRMFDSIRSGARHRLNFNTSTTLFNYFPLSFGANYSEVWRINSIQKYYNSENKLVTKDVNGFKSYRTFGGSISLQTVLYGTKIFGSVDDDKMIKAIRHMVSPSISFNYRPDFGTDFWGYYDKAISADGQESIYSYFDGGLYGSPSRGLQQSLSFAINNNVEIKVKDDDSPEGVKKIKILETLNISSGYNFAADSMRLSNINISGRTSLFNRKLGISFRALIDPYRVEFSDKYPKGHRVDKIGNFRLSNYGFDLSYSFNQDTFGKRSLDYDMRGAIRYEDFYFDNLHYAQFLTPWSLSVNLSHKVNSTYDSQNHNTYLGLSGRISPTPHWSVSGRTSINLQKMDFAGTYFTFSRDLRSFILDFSLNPFGNNKSWNFFIGIKANMFRDALKYEERNFRTNNNL